MRLDKTKDTHTLFEVYGKRALYNPIAGLVMLDRDTSKRKAEKSARTWGGCVVEVTCTITKWYPLARTVIASKVVYVHRPRDKQREPGDDITRKQLMGKLRRPERTLYEGRRNKKK